MIVSQCSGDHIPTPMSSFSLEPLDENSRGACSSSSKRSTPSPLPLSVTAPNNEKLSQPAVYSEAAGSGEFTPPGSPGTELHRDASVQELFQSARSAFGGCLQPREGDIAALDHPVRRGPSRMVTAQDWNATEREEQGATPTVVSSVLPAHIELVLEEEEEDEEEEEQEEVGEEVTFFGFTMKCLMCSTDALCGYV